MLVNEAVLTLEVEIRDLPFVQELQCKRDGADVELRLRPVQQAQGVQGVEQLASSDKLHEEVDVRVASERADKLDDERVVQLRQNAPLQRQGLLLPLLHRLGDVHGLQCVADQRLGVLDHLYHAEAAAADHAHALQLGELHVRVLKGDPVLHVVQDRALHYPVERLAAHLPELRGLHGLHGGTPWLAVEQRALADVVADSECADPPVADGDFDLAAVDDVELLGLLSLGEDHLAWLHKNHHEPLRQSHQLLRRQGAKDDHLLQRARLVIMEHGQLHARRVHDVAPVPWRVWRHVVRGFVRKVLEVLSPELPQAEDALQPRADPHGQLRALHAALARGRASRGARGCAGPAGHRAEAPGRAGDA
mmetsp:Transcript_34684/g.89043  ORF Transcript_34684/g.89043 Transcript_34684/m.89043 type:complete len:363 (+) Transcript_34684:605-1693(+)